MVSPALWKSSLRYTLVHRWQTVLSFIGIALGVAIVVAVDLANESARRAFALSLSTVAGPITHQIVSNSGGIDEQLFVQLRTRLAVAASAPRVQANIKFRGESFTLLGSDPISELSLRRHRMAFDKETIRALRKQAEGVILLAQTARRLGLDVGDQFSIQYQGRLLELSLSAVFDSPDGAALAGVMFTDIANAQHLLGRRGTLDRIDLKIDDGQTRKIKDWLPPAYRLIDAPARDHGLLAMSRAFHTNLTAMSLLTLLVGALLIYNTMRFSAMRRRAVVGTYRALGVTRRELLTLMLGEALVLATVASAAGTLLGYLLSQHLVQLVTRTVNDLYFALTVSNFLWSPWSLAKGIGLGLVASLLATLLPAIAASKVPPITLQRRSETERQSQRRYQALAIIGTAGLIGGYLYSLMPGDSLVEGFVSLAIMVTSFCLIVPAVLSLGCRLLEALLSPVMTVNSHLAIRGVVAGISRTGIAVAALSVALATVIGVTVMISSFRHSVEIWLTQSLRGDIYISVPGTGQEHRGAGIPEKLVEALRRLDGVERVITRRTFRSETDAGRLRTVSTAPRDHDNNSMLLDSVDNAHELYAQNKGLFISEPLAYHQQLKAGDQLTLYTQQGPRPFTVLGIFRDYSSSRGVIAMPEQLLIRYWQPVPITGVFINRTPSSSQISVLSAVRQQLKDYPEHLILASNQAIRDRSLVIFDRTFAITHVLRLLVLIVAFIGLLSALLALQLEKSREYAILRATGMSRRQLGGLILQQTTLLGIISAILALPLGYLLADRLIHVINLRSFGWSMEQIFPLEILPQSFLLAVSAAILAAVYPVWKLQCQAIAASLREE